MNRASSAIAINTSSVIIQTSTISKTSTLSAFQPSKLYLLFNLQNSIFFSAYTTGHHQTCWRQSRSYRPYSPLLRLLSRFLAPNTQEWFTSTPTPANTRNAPMAPRSKKFSNTNKSPKTSTAARRKNVAAIKRLPTPSAGKSVSVQTPHLPARASVSPSHGRMKSLMAVLGRKEMKFVCGTESNTLNMSLRLRDARARKISPIGRSKHRSQGRGGTRSTIAWRGNIVLATATPFGTIERTSPTRRDQPSEGGWKDWFG